MRNRLIALPLAALALLALTTAVLAGGWAQVTVQDPPVDPPVGGETTINLEVLQHGVTAVSWPALTVVATNTDSGDVMRTKAEAEGPEGNYVATLSFPSAGEWTLTYESPELVMEGSLAMNVAPAVVAAAPATATSATTSGAGPDLMPLALVLLGAVLAVAIGGLLLRRARSATKPGVPVRT